MCSGCSGKDVCCTAGLAKASQNPRRAPDLGTGFTGRSPRRNGVSRQTSRAIQPIENLASHLSELQKTTGEALSVFDGVVSSTQARFFGRTVVFRERAEGESVRSNPRGSPRRRRRQAYGTSRPARTVSDTQHRCTHAAHARRLPQPATTLSFRFC